MERTSRDFFSAPRLNELQTKVLEKEVKTWSRPEIAKGFAAGSKRLLKTLRQCPRPMWSFTLRKDHWTIQQVLWHLADQEANLYVRLRLAAAQPGSKVPAYDQNIWADRLSYLKADPIQARDLIVLLRDSNADLLKRLPSKAWGQKVHHPEWGTLTLGFLLNRNIWHLEHHLRQMERRLQEWKARKG